MKYDKELDCRGYFCPMPIINTKNELDNMPSGSVLKIISDDAGSKKDFPVWCSETGNLLEGTEHGDREFVFYIKKT